MDVMLIKATVKWSQQSPRGWKHIELSAEAMPSSGTDGPTWEEQEGELTEELYGKLREYWERMEYPPMPEPVPQDTAATHTNGNGQQAPQSTEGDVRFLCHEHQAYWRKRGNMKTWGHRVPDPQDSQKTLRFCNMPKDRRDASGVENDQYRG